MSALLTAYFLYLQAYHRNLVSQAVCLAPNTYLTLYPE